MLTTSDYSSLRKIIREEVRPIVKEEVGIALKPINHRLDSVENQLKDLKPIKRKLSKIEKIVKEDFNHLDRTDLRIIKAVNKIESHTKLPVTNLLDASSSS